MFPFKKSCEFSFQVNDNQDDQSPANMYMAGSSDAGTAEPSAGSKGKRPVGGRGRGLKPIGDDGDMKKVVHRDTERQRREVMASHLSTLRSLLPLEIVKEKRSVSDHIAESVNYIKHLQKNVKELGEKRDRQRTFRDSPPFKDQSSTSSGINVPIKVTIHVNNGGLQIQITGGRRGDGFHLSGVLDILLEEGLSVVCSVSNKVNGIFVHSIQCQVSDYTDIQRIQQRLYDLLSSNSSSSKEGVVR